MAIIIKNWLLSKIDLDMFPCLCETARSEQLMAVAAE
jgi:hypothetical protein